MSQSRASLWTTATLLAAAALLLATPCPAEQRAPSFAAEILRELPHDPTAFTQGLLLHNGVFYESTGHYGESELRVVRPESGRVLRSRALPPDLFAEGIAQLAGRIVQLTWKSGRALLWDARTLGRAGEARIDGQGWGLTAGPDALYLSDGTDLLTRLSLSDLRPLGTIAVRHGGQALKDLNELEYVRGLVLANVWFEDTVAAVDPESGLVAGWIDLSPLRPRLAGNAGVANGIAWDGARLFVTGKNWDKVFEISVPELPWKD